MFRNDVRRTDEQFGIFGEATVEIVPDTFAVTLGARYYDVEVDLEGSANSSFCNLSGPNGTDVNAFGTDISDLYNDDGQITFRGSCNPANQITYTLDTIDANTPAQVVAALNNAPDAATTNGVILKATATWTPTDDLLFYATYSEGFRPGLLNRPGGAQGPGGFTVPFALDTDDVTNYEFGWKTQLFNRDLRFNGSIFYVEIERLQTTIFDPSITNLFFSDNAADAEIWGIEGDIAWRPYSLTGLTIAGAFSILDTEITDVLTPTNDVLVGSELAFAPGFQGNMRLRYEWDFAPGFTAHIMPQITHSASSFTDIIEINKYRLDSWTTLGLSAGVATDDWSIEAFADNLTNERAEISGTFVNDRARTTVNRPLTVGMRFSAGF
nr:TonB-dependent receptor [uncultured Parasphingopyxis sp.]